MADRNDPTIADIIERLENVEAVLMQLINGGDDPDPDDGAAPDMGNDIFGNDPNDAGDAVRRTGDSAVNLRARLLAADAVTRDQTTALLRRMNAKAAAMYGRQR